MRFVIYHDELGVYLGTWQGMGFWSKLDPAGQDRAATFATEAAAREWEKKWHQRVADYRVVPVRVSGFAGIEHATIEECVAAGLPRWFPYWTKPA